MTTENTDTHQKADFPTAPYSQPLNSEQRGILYHTLHRAAGGRYCGGSPDMNRLVELGYMQKLGKPEWTVDYYYGITSAGKRALRAANAKRLAHADENLNHTEK